MIALVLAAAVVVTPALPPEIAASCDPMRLAPMLSAPKKDQIGNEMTLDRHIAAALAEERRLDVELTEEGKRAEAARAAASKGVVPLALLALVGLAMCVIAARRGSLPMALAAWALVATAGLFGWRMAARTAELSASHQALTARELAVLQCRTQITETRRMLMQSRLANCAHDLDEADEDIWNWVGRFGADGKMPTVEDLKKLHGEIREALKY